MMHFDHTNKLVIVLLAAALGAWGCAKVSGESNEETRLKVLETKLGKMEADLQTAAADRDQLRQKLETVEKERTAIQKQVQLVLQERNDLRLQLNARTTERDNLQSQYDSFRTDVRRLLNQADAAAAQSATHPVTVAGPTPTPGKS